MKDLIFRTLFNSHLGHDYFPLIDVLRKQNDMKEKINNLGTL